MGGAIRSKNTTAIKAEGGRFHLSGIIVGVRILPAGVVVSEGPFIVRLRRTRSSPPRACRGGRVAWHDSKLAVSVRLTRPSAYLSGFFRPSSICFA